MQFEIVVVTPVSAAITISPEISLWHREALDEIAGVSGQIRCFDGWDTVDVDIRVIHDPAKLPPLQERWQGPRDRLGTWLKFSITSEIDIVEYTEVLFERNKDRDPIEEPIAIAFAKEQLGTALSARVGDVILASNIARPGSLQGHGRYEFDATRFLGRTSGLFNYFADAVQQCRQFSWPPLRPTTLVAVLNWLDSVPAFENGRPQGPSGIALSALSHLCSEPPPTSSPAGLMWSMVGIEALYGDGNEGLKRQIMTKTEIALGPRTSYKKRFDRIYDVRSRFIHGDSEFRLAYSPYDSLEQEPSDTEINEAFLLAQGILLSSLQELVSLGRSSFEFEYRLVD